MKKYIAGLFLMPIFFSCSKVIDTAPTNSFTDVSAYSSTARCALVLNGVYDAAQSAYYVGGTSDKRGYPFGAASIEQGDCRGEDVILGASFFSITYQNTYNSSAGNCVGMWKGLYILINDANLAIAGFKGAAASGILTSAVELQYEAECRFLRAMSHHEALVLFARPYSDGAGNQVGIPWRETPINSTASVNTILNTPRMRVDSVYMKILADLDFAEANLPATAPANYRASKAAAIALKMRIKLHMGDWAGVATEGAKLVPTTVNPLTPTSVVSPIGNWALTASPDGPFANNSSVESMFSIKNDALDNPGVNGALFQMYASTNKTGRGLIGISPVLWNNPSWLSDDKRKSSILAQSGGSTSYGQLYFSTKYRDSVGKGDYAPMVRYAEVLLTLAEATARSASGVSQRAIDLLNVVRNRSLAAPTTQQYTAASFASQTALVKAILFERRVEFVCEGKRWDDISRLGPDATYTTGGIPAKAVLGAGGLTIYNNGLGYTPTQVAIPYSDYRFIWPIPASEIVSNPIVAQNPNY